MSGPTGWYVYALVSDALDATYVGVATDVARRLAQHNGEQPGGARATRRGRPWRLAATHGPLDDRGAAQRLEHAIKRHRGRARLAALRRAGADSPSPIE